MDSLWGYEAIMIEQADQRLLTWIQTALQDTDDITLGPPGSSVDGRGVRLYLLALAPFPSVRTNHRPPLQFKLRYLITTYAENEQEAHRLLGDLVFAAMDEPDFEVELDSLESGVWVAFETIPQPYFILKVPLRRERPEQHAQLVRQPPVVNTVPVTTLSGQVIDHEDRPLSNALVELIGLDRTQHSDRQGRFHFSSIPGDEQNQRLRVTAKGRSFELTVDPAEPLTIRFDQFQ